MNESSFYCVLPFFGRKDARYRLEPFRDNVRFRFCGWPFFLFWEFWPSLAAWDSLLVIQSVTCCDVFFHQLQFVEFGLVTLVFCDSSKLLFVSLPVDTGIFLNKSVNTNHQSLVNYKIIQLQFTWKFQKSSTWVRYQLSTHPALILSSFSSDWSFHQLNKTVLFSHWRV